MKVTGKCEDQKKRFFSLLSVRQQRIHHFCVLLSLTLGFILWVCFGDQYYCLCAAFSYCSGILHIIYFSRFVRDLPQSCRRSNQDDTGVQRCPRISRKYVQYLCRAVLLEVVVHMLITRGTGDRCAWG